MSTDDILVAENLTKEFRGFRAVDNVSLRIRTGSIHALIGPNGAGKTTCFNLLTRFLQPTSGRIRFDGHDVTNWSPDRIARASMVRSFQISAVFPDLTCLQNVRVALQRKGGSNFNFWRSERRLHQYDNAAHELLDRVGLAKMAGTRATELAYGRKRALELATTLALNPKMMLLDEPMAGMGREDISRITELILDVAKDRTLLLVEHNLSVVEALSDTITVLARGRVLAEGDYASVSSNPDVIEAYIGADHE